MKCNVCWKHLDSSFSSYYTTHCWHLFCQACKEKCFVNTLCPVCDAVLPKASEALSKLTISPDADRMHKICALTYGMEPQNISSIYFDSIEFWAHQQANENLMHQKNCKISLQRVHHLELDIVSKKRSIEQERIKNEKLVNENSELLSLCRNIDEKYKSLERHYARLQTSYQQLKATQKKIQNDLILPETPSMSMSNERGPLQGFHIDKEIEMHAPLRHDDAYMHLDLDPSERLDQLLRAKKSM